MRSEFDYEPDDRRSATTEHLSKEATVHSLAYDEPGAQLELFTETLVPVSTAGIIREALLTTVVHPTGPTLCRLRLLVNYGDARALNLAFPAEYRPDADSPRRRGGHSDSIGIRRVDSVFRGDSRVEIEHNRR